MCKIYQASCCKIVAMIFACTFHWIKSSSFSDLTKNIKNRGLRFYFRKCNMLTKAKTVSYIKRTKLNGVINLVDLVNRSLCIVYVYINCVWFKFLFMQAGVSDDKSHNIAKTILLAMGEFFQIQVSSLPASPHFPPNSGWLPRLFWWTICHW